VIETIFAVMASRSAPWLLSLAIVLLAAWLWFDLKLRLERVAAALERATRLVEETDGQVAFRARFPVIFKGLAENPVLGDAWRAYAPTLTNGPAGIDGIGYARRPGTAFHLELVSAAGVDVRFYHAVPNLLVGLGLFFTFLGLVAALHFASGGVGQAEIATAQLALRDLLAAATFKFVTSIAGLGCSLLYSMGEKRLFFAVQRRLERFVAALEARMVPLTAESLGALQLEELRAQTAQLRQVTRGLLVRLPESVEGEVAAAAVAAMQPLAEGVKSAALRLDGLDAALVDRLARELAPLLATGELLRAIEGLAARLDRLELAPAAPDAATAVRPRLARLDRLIGRLAAAARRPAEPGGGAAAARLAERLALARGELAAQGPRLPPGAAAAEALARLDTLLRQLEDELPRSQPRGSAARPIEADIAAGRP
jgi:hypothetical protein